MDKINIGIIGAGGVAQLGHIPSYKKMENVEVVAICDPNKIKLKKVAKKFNIPKTFTDYHSLLNLEEIQAVSICSPNFLHAEHTIAALKSKKHVLCEKPVGTNSHEVESVIQEAENSGRKFMVAFCHRFDPASQTIKSFIDKGELGEIYYAKASYLRRRGIPGLGGWFTTKKLSGGGALIDIGVHMLDLSLWLLGNPEPLSVTASIYDKLKTQAIDGGWPPIDSRKGDIYGNIFDVEDLATAFIKFKNGSTLFLEASWAGYSETGIKISLFGSKGGVELRGAVGGIDEGRPNYFKFHKKIDNHLVDISPVIPETYSYWDDPWPNLVQHFINCIRENGEPIVKLQEILYGSRIIDAIYKSAEEGKIVKI